MEHTHTAHDEHHASGKKEVKKVTIILSVLTIVELILGFMMIGMESAGLKLAIKGVIVILMLAKAFYIVAYFMHLGHELKNLIMTIVVPLALFIWFIIAFLYDGNSYLNYQMKHDRYKNEKSKEKATPPAKHGEEHPTEKSGTAH